MGEEAVRAPLRYNAKVYIAAQAEAATKDLKDVTGRDAIFLELDLSSLASAHKAAEKFPGKERELHILFNNARVFACSPRTSEHF